jgi:hypothetical protein
MSGTPNPSNRPNTIDIQLINKNLSEKMNAIRNTGKVEEVGIHNDNDNNNDNNDNNTVLIAQQAETMQNSPKKGTSFLRLCKYPIMLFVLYVLIHNKFTSQLLSKIKIYDNIESPLLRLLIKGILLVILFNTCKLCV